MKELKFIRKDLQKDIIEIKDPMQEKSKEDILKDIIKETYIDLKNKEYKQAPAFLSIRKDIGFTPIFTPSNISAITGKAKARKSFVQSMMIASVTKNGMIDDTIHAKLPKGKENIILFDTEQSEYHVSNVAKRVNKLIKYEAENLYIYSLRGLDAETIIDILNYTTENIKDIGVIFIDQIADLTKSINSEEEAVKIVKTLEKISKEKELHICCVIHQNKGDNFASGWLGSQIMKKAETVISVSIDAEVKTISHVEPSLTRNVEFKSFQMQINEEGIPYVLDVNSENENNNYNANEYIEPSKDIFEDLPESKDFEQAPF